jgi:YidC/Oxa1 family membrane protein insertase
MLRSSSSCLIQGLQHPRRVASSAIWNVVAGGGGISSGSSSSRSDEHQNHQTFFLPRPFLTLSAASSSARFFSSSSSTTNNSGDITSSTTTSSSSSSPSSSIDETLNRLFEENKLTADDAGAAWSGTGAADTVSAVANTLTEYEPSYWYNIADQAIVAVGQIHTVTGLDYGWSIVLLTTSLRLLLFPVMGLAQQTTSRMAHVQPELQALQAKVQRLGTPTRAEQIQIANQYKATFRKYQVRPMWAFIAPLLQLPIFGGLFFGLRKLPELFPTDLSHAGMMWFTDLSQPDPLYILPVLSSAAVLAMFELSKGHMAAQSPGPQGMLMLNFFRVMAVMMVPVTISFSSSVLLMWTTNSSLMLLQTALFQTKFVRDAFGIWTLPKPIPGQDQATKGIVDSVTDMVKRAQGEATTEPLKMERHNQEVEARKTSFRLARERRLRRSQQQKTGITGTRNV